MELKLTLDKLLIKRLFLIFCTIFIVGNPVSFAQKADLRKAAQFFKEDKYAAAIPFYKKALAAKKSLSTQTRLAFCYKITNQMAEAAALYEEIVQHDRAKSKTYYYYAETLMSSGQYDQAKTWFKKYAVLEPEDEAAEKMMASCDFAKTVPPYFGNALVNTFSQNSEEDDNAPVFWDNGIIFTSDRKGKLKLLDTKSGETGRNYLRLYHSKALADGTYSEPKEYISKINDARKNTGMATFQADGSAMFFTRNGTYLNRQNAYCLQLFEAKSADGQRWKSAEVLPFCSKGFNYMHPAVSPDGKLLFFVSDKSRGLGGTDIYVSKKTKKGWGRPENLGEKINTISNEGFPFMHPNGKLYFCSKGHLGLGGFDVFVTQLNKEGVWEKPINLGAPINSPADDISIFIDEKEENGLFTSSREGGDDDVFLLSFSSEMLTVNQPIHQPITAIPPAEKIATTTASIDAIPMISTPNLTTTEQVVIIEPPIPVVQEELIVPPAQLIEPEEKVIAQRINFIETKNWKVTAIKEASLFSLPTIHFETEAYFVTYKIAKELDKVANILRKHPQLKIELGAHTANLGNFKDRATLTRYRVEAMAAYLEKKGIGSYRIQPKGYGGEQPLNNCLMDIDCTIEEHAVNERIEIKIQD